MRIPLARGAQRVPSTLVGLLSALMLAVAPAAYAWSFDQTGVAHPAVRMQAVGHEIDIASAPHAQRPPVRAQQPLHVSAVDDLHSGLAPAARAGTSQPLHHKACIAIESGFSWQRAPPVQATA